MPITDLNALIQDFTHPAHLEAYLRAFTDAFLAGKIQAIPGKEITTTLNKKKITTCSYVVLQDDAFDRWHAQTVKHVLELSFDAQKVASVQSYGQISEDLFLLFAEQAREQRKAEQPDLTPTLPPKPKKPRAPKVMGEAAPSRQEGASPADAPAEQHNAPPHSLSR